MRKTFSFKFVLAKHKPPQISSESKIVKYLALAILILAVILGIAVCPEAMRDLISHIIK